MTNRFKGLDLTDRVPEELWMEVFNIVQKVEIKTILKKIQCKSRKSRNTRQVWPWSTEWSRAKANRVLPRECTGHSKHSLPTTQGKTLHVFITRCSTPKSDWLYFLQPKMEKLYTVSKNKIRSWLWLRPWTSYCQIQTYFEKSEENHKIIQVWPKSNPLQLYSGSEK